MNPPAGIDSGICPSLLPAASKTVSSTDTGSPAPSTIPKFVRYALLCATCWSERICLAAPEGAFEMNCANGTAGMNCPNVPLVVELYVRLETTVVSDCVSVLVDANALVAVVDVSGR